MGVLKKVVKKYPNGNIHEEYTENECGDKFGEYKEFDVNGKLKTLYYYEDDVMKRHCIDFYENGNKEYETIYYGTDISFRTFIHYYENGQIETSTDMLDDDNHGKHLEYYEDGKLKEEVQYRNY
jgi:antitoxin component YwqK of YwqJK toxin-antitoxin module